MEHVSHFRRTGKPDILIWQNQAVVITHNATLSYTHEPVNVEQNRFTDFVTEYTGRGATTSNMVCIWTAADLTEQTSWESLFKAIHANPPLIHELTRQWNDQQATGFW